MIVQIFPAKMRTFPGRKQQWYVRLFEESNHTVLVTSEGYASKWNAKRAAKRMFPALEREVLDS